MKESDYINVSNLARLRIASECLRACLINGKPFTAEEVTEFRAIEAKLYNVFTAKLEAAIDGRVK